MHYNTNLYKTAHENIPITTIFFYLEDLDPCEGVTCQHDGTCKANGTSYTCECKKGYTGQKCEGQCCLPVSS
jgi:hypothetical protein